MWYQEILDQSNAKLAKLKFRGDVAAVYNPLEYARAPHELYLKKYTKNAKRKALLLGMNPGPWGMAQTGIPFGEVAAVRDWLRLEAEVGKPQREHPKRPVEGFACQRSEVSGRRLWGGAAEAFGTPRAFFKEYIVINYCPLVFMGETGKNITPDKLPVAERKPLEAICDETLRAWVDALRPERLVGVGGFAAKRLQTVFPEQKAEVGQILHPSPASPLANRGWAPKVDEQLRALGLPVGAGVQGS